MSRIEKQYHEAEDGFPPERAYLEELKSWLLQQPQDAWLIFVKHMNWDSMDRIADELIGIPDCDIAIVSWIFWLNEPGYHIRHPKDHWQGARNYRILENVKKGHYKTSELAFDRSEIMAHVQGYAEERRKLDEGDRPFDVPLALFGPFHGRRAALADPPDAATQAHLDEIFEALGASPIDFSEPDPAPSPENVHDVANHMELPELPPDAATRFQHLDELDYIDRVFGPRAAYQAGLKKLRDTLYPAKAISLGTLIYVGIGFSIVFGAVFAIFK